MNKKFLLTSLFALGFAGPAMAATTVNSFPDPQAESPAEVLPDRIYTGAATYDNIHVYSGDVWAVAQYISNICPIVPGTYLPSATLDSSGCSVDSAESCLNGYYCPGGSYEYKEGAIGLEQCPNGYNSSDSRAVVKEQCYKACDSSAYAHANTMSGHDYYGYAADTCEPATCVDGWKVVGAESVNVDSKIDENVAENSATFHTAANGNVRFNPEGSAVDSAWFGLDGDIAEGLWWINYGAYHGLLLGQARLSDVAGTNGAMSNNGPTIKTTVQLNEGGTGNHCYCGLVKYNPYTDFGNPMLSPWIKLTSSWAYYGTANSLEACASGCEMVMANKDRESSVWMGFRRALLGTATGYMPAKCVAETITVHWTGATSVQISAAGAGTATYGGNIKTPSGYDASLVPSGHKFAGWKFFATEQ